VELNIDDELDMNDVYALLKNNYVEDNDAMFRFDYQPNFLRWALKPPGWIAKWHVGIRVETSNKLVAFISAIPIELQVRSKYSFTY
jgi:glycylpeptide N-tetradecanoyltransferase